MFRKFFCFFFISKIFNEQHNISFDKFLKHSLIVNKLKTIASHCYPLQKYSSKFHFSSESIPHTPETVHMVAILLSILMVLPIPIGATIIIMVLLPGCI